MNRYQWLVAIALSSLFTIGCGGGGGGSSSANTPPIQPGGGNGAPIEFAGLTGFFESVGHGFVIEIDVEANALGLYHITESSCVSDPDFDVTLNQVFDQLEIGRTPDDNDRFTSKDRANDRQTTFFERVAQLPDSCSNTVNNNDPEYNFQVFWETFNEQYAFFNERGVDWAIAYENFRPLVTSDTTSQELFTILSDLASSLEDTHVSIESTFGNFNSGETPEYIAAQALADRPEINTIIRSYLDADWIEDPRGFMRYGTINGNVGYIQINQFGEPADSLALEDQLVNFIDSAITEFVDHDGIIIDVRNNVGGGDGLVLRITNRFTDSERVAFREHVRDGNSFSPLITFSLTPEGNNIFLKPVVILAGPTTVSSGENLVLSFLELPQTTVIGESTNGTLSTRLHKLLPNGTRYTLSNEIQLSPTGTVYEVIGAPASIDIPAFSEEDIELSIDSALEAAIDLLTP